MRVVGNGIADDVLSFPGGARFQGQGDLPWDYNGNGCVTRAEAWRHGIAPVRRDHPAYQYMRDGDGDGIVCE